MDKPMTIYKIRMDGYKSATYTIKAKDLDEALEEAYDQFELDAHTGFDTIESEVRSEVIDE